MDKDFNNDNLGHRESFLSRELCNSLRDTINSSTIFANDPKYLEKYNLCCAVMDRLDTCIEYLNRHDEYPDTEEDFLTFMMFACMVVDAVKEVLSELGVYSKNGPVPNSEEAHMFFGDIYRRSRIYNPDVDIPDDVKFFEYLRSLAFAHPFETSRPRFLKNGEKQYSPWVIVNRMAANPSICPDPVGVRIYTNQSEEIIDLKIPFSLLKDYIKSRYNRLELAIDWAQMEIKQAMENWRQAKIDRDKAPIDILVEIDQILSSRYYSCSFCKEAITCLICELTLEKNRASVAKFRDAIIAEIPEICDAVDDLDNELIEDIFYRVFRYPDKMHPMAHYQLEKIFTYPDESSGSFATFEDVIWASKQADAFAEQFAKKWVTINTSDMSYCEIRLLIRTACYLERCEQERIT